jgi:hypothetical protein
MESIRTTVRSFSLDNVKRVTVALQTQSADAIGSIR